MTIFLSILIGGVTASGSVIAWAKLAEVMPSRALVFGGQRLVNGGLLLDVVASGVLFCMEPELNSTIFFTVLTLALVLGVMTVIPIGGADMPVVISLLNSYSGLAACAALSSLRSELPMARTWHSTCGLPNRRESPGYISYPHTTHCLDDGCPGLDFLDWTCSRTLHFSNIEMVYSTCKY